MGSSSSGSFSFFQASLASFSPAPSSPLIFFHVFSAILSAYFLSSVTKMLSKIEPPMIDNPDYKGEWKAPMIDNPDYKGPWEHTLIPNKDYAPETYAKYKDLTTVGFELWTVNGGSIFDNILVTDDKKYADKMAEKTWKKIKGDEGAGEKEAKEAWKKENEPEEEE